MTLPATPTSVIIGGLVPGTSYSIRAAAWTSGGVGPASPSASLTMDSLSFTHRGSSELSLEGPTGAYPFDGTSGVTSDVTQVVQETWFILAIGGVLLAMLVLLIAALVIRRRWARNKAMSSVSKVEPPGLGGAGGGLGGAGADDHSGSLSVQVRGRDIIWSRGWHSAANGSVGDSLKQAEMEAQAALLPQYADTGVATRCGLPPPEYAELSNNHNQVISFFFIIII